MLMNLNTRGLIAPVISYFNGNRRFFDAFTLGTLSSVLSQGLNFVTLVFITRHLGESNMGHYALIQSTVIMLITFGILGQNVSSAALSARFRKRYPNHLGQLIGNSYIITIISTVFVSLASIGFSDVLFSDILVPEAGKFFSKSIIVLWFAGMTFDMMQAGTLVGLEAYRDLLRTDILKGSFAILIILPLAIFKGLPGVLVGYVLSSFIGMTINQWFIRRALARLEVKIVFKINFLLIRRIMKIGLPVFVAALFMSPTTWITNKLVFDAEGGPYALGIVFVCRQLLVLMQFIPVQISRVTLPIIANRLGTQEELSIKRLSLLAGLSICIIFVLGGMLFEGPILSIYGLDAEVSSMPYRVTLLTLVFSGINIIVGQFAIAGKNPWNRAYADGIIALVIIAVTLLMIRVNLLLALPLASLIAFILSNLFLIYATRNEIPWIRKTRFL
jgi:O-antigen/teichoic acid export membrane protein